MDRSAKLFAVTTLVTVIVAATLWGRLQDERNLTAQLREALRKGAVVQPVYGAAFPVPVPSAPPPPSATPQVDASALVPPTASLPRCEQDRLRIRDLMGNSHAEAIRHLGLSPEESRVLVDLYSGQMRIPACEGSDQPTLGPGAFREALEQALGSARTEQLEEFEAARSARVNISTLAGQVPAEHPLSADQRARLESTILDEQRRSRSDLAAMRLQGNDARSRLQHAQAHHEITMQRYDRVLAAAQAYLHPAQLATLQGNLERQGRADAAALERLRAEVEAVDGAAGNSGMPRHPSR